MLMKVLKYPDPFLTKVATVADLQTPEEQRRLRTLAHDMFETMYKNNGIGLAATQVGEDCRMFVISTNNWPLYNRDKEWEEFKSARNVYVNPVIVSKSEDTGYFNEGCLSVPGVTDQVVRARSIEVEYQTLTGELVQEKLSGLMAECFQHELDHLNGVIFIDHIPDKRRKKLDKKLGVKHE